MAFNHQVAVRLSAIAYKDIEVADKMAREMGYRVREFFSDGPAQAYLFESDADAYLVHRGTSLSRFALWDIFSNMRVMAREWDGPGRVHLGYANQYIRIREASMYCASIVAGGKPLYLSGHSMGGSMTHIAAADIYHRNWKIAGVATFGAPKALDQEAIDIIRCDVYRYVNKYDFAPYFPPSFSLKHPGFEMPVDSGGWRGPITRHMPSKYIKAVDLYYQKVAA